VPIGQEINRFGEGDFALGVTRLMAAQAMLFENGGDIPSEIDDGFSTVSDGVSQHDRGQRYAEGIHARHSYKSMVQ